MTPGSVAQLPLPFAEAHAPRYGVTDFVAAQSNEAARRWLVSAWPDGRLALWGAAGTGKSHLLHIEARRRGAQVLKGPDLLPPPGPPATACIVDDADEAPELALLHWLNAAREAGQAMLLAARQPPSRWLVRLPDLASRLRSITAVEIFPPHDDLLGLLLDRLLQERHVAVKPGVTEWLLLRLPRSAAAIREAAKRLDDLSIAAKGHLTRATVAAAVKDLLGDLPDSGPDGDDDSAKPVPPASPPGGATR